MRSLEDLNFNHLFYFWTVAREGSVSEGSQRLQLAQPTVSMTIRKLEKTLGLKLFERVGRGLVLTESGRDVFHYADSMFSLGQELMALTQGRSVGQGQRRVVVGIQDILPKLIAYRLLEPVFQLGEPIEVICQERPLDELLSELAMHRMDVVLADSPLTPTARTRAFNHLLGECGVTIYGTATLARRYRDKFPASLNGAPLLLPTDNTQLRRSLDQWLDAQDLHPRIVGQCFDSALLKEFGRAGIGLFPGPQVIAREICEQYRVEVVGQIVTIRERFYAIAAERQLRHPAVLAITDKARNELFSRSAGVE